MTSIPHHVLRDIAAVALLLAVLHYCCACATFYQRCEYFPDGTLKAYASRSTVLGTGDTEAVSTDCAATGYSTHGTGLSDNAREALGKIAEGVAAGAVKGVLPSPIIFQWDAIETYPNCENGCGSLTDDPEDDSITLPDSSITWTPPQADDLVDRQTLRGGP